MKVRLFLSSLALVFGAVVVSVSLVSASKVNSDTGTMAQRSIYWDRPIGPDHSLYWALMINDRLRLETADPVNRVHLQVSYANTRLIQGQELIDDEQYELAASTITKSQKYLLKASQEYLELESPSPKLTSLITKTLDYHLKESKQVVHALPDEDRTAIDQLRTELEMMRQQIDS